MTTNRIRIQIALAMVFIFAASAQTFRGRVEGTVTDQSRAVIINSTVTLTNVNTSAKVVRRTSGTGLFVFDGVDPGTYSIMVEMSGFSKFVQENILVQTGGDVTVNAALTPGSVTSSVTVSESPVAVEFNSTNRDLTIDTKLAEEVPRLDRNPFKLGLLAPYAYNTRNEMHPYDTWAPNSVDLGGGTNLKNDLQVDGSPITMGHKSGYVPNTDDVQEVVVSQNSVDAETGHSGGGAITITTKSGTNDWHGTGFYVGRYPWLSAVADRTRMNYQATRQNMFGGTLGSPIIKNRLFNFFSMEYWKVGSPSSYVTTVPTGLEKNGDFSQTLNAVGSQRTIFDPYTTVLNPGTGAVTVTPFAGNVIPKSRFDAAASPIMQQFWAPNNPGDDPSGVNNYKVPFPDNFSYRNFSDRVDYNVNDKWKFYGRISNYHKLDIQGNPTPAKDSALYIPTGTQSGAWQVAGGATWLIDSRTVLDLHGDFHTMTDELKVQTKYGFGSFWPNSDWYKTYTNADTGVPSLPPQLIMINSQNYSGYGGPGSYWNQQPKGEAINAKISQQRGSHFLKAGLEYRRSFGSSYVSNMPSFWSNAYVTANTFNNPDTLHYGDEWATFLLGSLDPSSTMVGGPAPDPHTSFYGMYFQDDWKLSRRITLNLGLRNDYEAPWWDPTHNFSKGLNLNQAIPEMQANPPTIPTEVSSIMGASPWKYFGQWQWTTPSSPGMWNPQKFALQPRAGIAFRIDDQTSLRIGYARYTTPTEFNMSGFPGFETVSFLEPPYLGMTQYQNPAPLLEGVPQSTFADPFPASNPLLPIQGKSVGGAVGRGQNGALLWYNQDMKKPFNDRLNISFQRQVPGRIVLMATYFANFGHNLYNRSLNSIDPNILLNYQNAVNVTVTNPFYHYLNQTVMPGPLYNQQAVPLRSLLVPYPQYSSIAEFGRCCAQERYNSVELRAQKVFSHGYDFLLSYVYIHEKQQIYFNDMDVYTGHLVYQDSDQPRHRISGAGTWEVPVGRGRSYLNSISRPVDFLLGGWKLVGVATLTSGDYPRFNNGYPPSTSAGMLVTGNPCISNPTPNQWFNTAAFALLPSNTYQLRTNPLQFSCLTGPRFFNLDGTLSKDFAITERVKVEFKIAAYNATNKLNRGDPVTDINSGLFGKALYQGAPGGTFGQQAASYGAGNSGRQSELGLKIIF
jgi:hypothetical protein